MNYLDEVYRQTADGGYFDFARCQRPDGSYYGTGGTCRIGSKVGAAEKQPSARGRGVSKDEGDTTHDIYKKALKSGLSKEGLQEVVSEIRAEIGKKVIGQQHIDLVVDRINRKLGGGAPSEKPSTKPQASAKPSAKPQPSAKPKKEAATPEQKAEEKWLKQEEKLKEIEKRRDELKAEIEAKGKKVFATGPGAEELNRRMKEEGLPSLTKLTSMSVRLRETMPERLKAERKAEKIRQVKEELANTPKEERKRLIAAARDKAEKRHDLTNEQHIKMVESNLEMMRSFIKSDPALDNLENRTAYLGLRALHLKMLQATKAQRAEQIAAEKKKQAQIDEAIKKGPQHSSTPGSTTPVKSAKDLGPKVAEYVDLKKKRDALKEKLDELEKLPWEERRAKGWQQIDDEHSLLNGQMIRLERGRDFMQLGDIYKAQGFNDKPELVATRDDLLKRTDLYTQPGTNANLIMYRGVTTRDFADQFKGLGPNGDTHYAGEGIYGNGTYAASTSPRAKGSLADMVPQGTAKSYAGSGGNPAGRITTFAFRKDANIVDWGDGDFDKRYNDFSKWGNQLRKDATEKYGVPFNDIGHAAAAMGIHAYRVPMSDQGEDYWVILNRGAIVSAVNTKLDQ